MVKAYKKEIVEQLKERLQDAKSIVVVDYKGINIEEVDNLRDRLRKENVDYFVAKNTYVKIALNELGVSELDDHMKGPSAVAVSKEDEVTPARIIAGFKKEVMGDKEFPRFKAGYVDGQLFLADDVDALSKLPSKDELLAKVLASFNSPIQGFVGALNGIIRQFVGVVDAIAKKQAEEN